jgi:hypothetical protein
VISACSVIMQRNSGRTWVRYLPTRMPRISTYTMDNLSRASYSMASDCLLVGDGLQHEQGEYPVDDGLCALRFNIRRCPKCCLRAAALNICPTRFTCLYRLRVHRSRLEQIGIAKRRFCRGSSIVSTR